MSSEEKFRIGKYITLKLEEGKTNIYIQNHLFNQCKFLFIPTNSNFDDIYSIDEVTEKLNREMEIQNCIVPPKDEFWGHCSNLQAWVEMKYDTRILHRNLAFPLLKKLADVGDRFAKHRFKEEIITRALSGSKIVLEYLSKEGYFEYLDEIELSLFLNTLLGKEVINISNLNRVAESENLGIDQLFKMELVKRVLSSSKIILNYLSKYLDNKDLFFIVEKLSFHNLDLKQSNLTRLSKLLSHLTFLVKLNLQQNKLTTLPDSIGSLTSLEYLDLSNNKLTTLPDSIGSLTSLEYLDLSNNDFVSLPESIRKLMFLRTLYLNNTKLAKFSMIGNLTSLEDLHLCNNSLRELPESIGNLNFLEELNLRSNLITKLPQSLFKLENLRSLGIDASLIAQVPRKIRKKIVPEYDY